MLPASSFPDGLTFSSATKDYMIVERKAPFFHHYDDSRCTGRGLFIYVASQTAKDCGGMELRLLAA